jgi:hypothetical protein
VGFEQRDKFVKRAGGMPNREHGRLHTLSIQRTANNSNTELTYCDFEREVAAGTDECFLTAGISSKIKK